MNIGKQNELKTLVLWRNMMFFYEKIRTNKATKTVGCAMESWDYQLSYSHPIIFVALLVLFFFVNISKSYGPIWKFLKPLRSGERYLPSGNISRADF